MPRWPLLLLLLLLASCSSAPTPTLGKNQKAPVILVHGLLSNGYWLKKLGKELNQEGHPALVPKLRPHDGSESIEILAQQLKAQIEENYGSRQAIHLVGHSMGGLVSRYYLEELGGSRRTLSLQTIATPHSGAPLSLLHPGKGGIQMRPGSQFLKELNAGPESRYPETSYYTKTDLIVPWRNSLRPRANNIEIPASIHHSLPYHPAVRQGVKEQIYLSNLSGKIQS